jgi:hypothetical protein
MICAGTARVKRRTWLIEKYERFECNRERNGDTLALTAGEFMRKTRVDIVGHAGTGQRFVHAVKALRAVRANPVDDQPFLDNLPDRQAPIERGKGSRITTSLCGPARNIN